MGEKELLHKIAKDVKSPHLIGMKRVKSLVLYVLVNQDDFYIDDEESFFDMCSIFSVIDLLDGYQDDILRERLERKLEKYYENNPMI